MKISELIIALKAIQEKEGDLNVCVHESHEYWGSLQNSLETYNIRVIDHAQPKGPKSGKS
jgi:hypothetical protein